MGWNDLIGQRLEHYEILSELGRGGSSRVYKAFDTQLQREVAIKVIPNDAEDRPAFLSRFDREVEAVRALHHPHIVAVYSYGENDELVYLVMQCVTGGTLRRRLKERLTMHQAIDYVVQMAGALQHAHERGIIHRDVKPSNMLLDAEHPDQLLLTDFGIAKIQGARQLTKSGTTVGTPEYMAPEQAEGREIDARADIYALGCVLYETLAGRPPFIGVTPVSILYQHVHSRPAYIRGFNPEVSRELALVIETALAKRPEERYTTASEFAEALQPFLGGGGLGAGMAMPVNSPSVPPVASTWAGLTQHSPQMQELPTVSGPNWPGIPTPGGSTPGLPPLVAAQTTRTTPDPVFVRPPATPAQGLSGIPAGPAARDDITERETEAHAPAIRDKRRLTMPIVRDSAHSRPLTAYSHLDESVLGARSGATARDDDDTLQRYAVKPLARQELAEPGYEDWNEDEQPTGMTATLHAVSGLPLRAGIAVVSVVLVLVLAVVAVSLSGLGSALSENDQPTATTLVVPTATATTLPTATTATTPTVKPTSTPNDQAKLNAQAATYFRAVTLANFDDRSCSSSNAVTHFNFGQAIYVNLCRSGVGSGNFSVMIQQNGSTVAHGQMATNYYMPAGTHYFFSTQYHFASGTYHLVVTTTIDGKTAVAKDIKFTIG